jgi:hypothetical protein
MRPAVKLTRERTRNDLSGTLVVLVGGLHLRDPWDGIDRHPLARDLGLRFVRFDIGEVSLWRRASGSTSAAVVLRLRDFVSGLLLQSDKLVLMTFGAGGILTKALLAEYSEEIVPKVRLVVFVATPHSGSRGLLGALARRIDSVWSSSKECTDQLNTKWDALQRQYDLDVVHVFGANDRISQYDMGRHWDTRNIVVLDSNHSQLGRDVTPLLDVLARRLGHVPRSRGHAD